MSETYVLCMIVKDEEHCIRRCLRSVKNHIQTWVINDTGSTDRTCDIIKEELAGLPGELLHREWVDFSVARNQALEVAKRLGTRAIIIDADDEFECPHPLPANPKFDCYNLPELDGFIKNTRPNLLNLSLDWEYTAPIHEQVWTDRCRSIGVFDRFPRILTHHEGSRSCDPQAYERDLDLMGKALAQNPEDAHQRYQLGMHLASVEDHYREAVEVLGDYLKAKDTNIPMAGNALMQIAMLKQRLGYPALECLSAYAIAVLFDPTRAESAVHMSAYCRSIGRPDMALNVMEKVRGLKTPTIGIGIDMRVYEYIAEFEYRCCLLACGKRSDGEDVMSGLLNKHKRGECILTEWFMAKIEDVLKKKFDLPLDATDEERIMDLVGEANALWRNRK